MPTPPYLNPFVVSVADAPRERDGTIDVYRPVAGGDGPSPVVVFVHGGPLPPDLQAAPRDWPIYVGYGSLAAESGALGVTVDHRLHSLSDYATAAADVVAAVQRARSLPGADPQRVALWFFSGGGLLAADWLRQPPAWLRCVAASYPVLAPLPGWNVDQRFEPVRALATAGRLPVLLTRAGRESAEFAATVDAFTEAAASCGTDLEVIDVPDGQHGFDMLDHTDNSRDAVTRAMSWVMAAVGR